MHVEDRRTRMLLLVLGHADTKHVVPAPCMALLQRPGRGVGGGGGAAGADSIAECERWACDTLGRCCSPHKPSPEPALPPTSLNAAVSPSAGRPMGCRGSSAAAQQQKFSSSSINSAVRSARRKRRLSTNLASEGPRDCCGVAWESPDRRSMPACPAGGAVPLSRGLQRPRDPR